MSSISPGQETGTINCVDNSDMQTIIHDSFCLLTKPESVRECQYQCGNIF